VIRAVWALALVLVIAGCSDDVKGEAPVSTGDLAGQTTTTKGGETSDEHYPDVIDVEVSPEGGNLYEFEVTISSPYDSPDQYADAWRVLAPDGTVLGVRELLHDHASQQPFTRSLSGVEIPEGVTTVTIEGRDLLNGWGGETMEVDVRP
jgi:hypothetical protein